MHVLVLSERYASAITAVEKSNEQLEEKVQERTADLIASEKHVRELVQNISHDLKTPMTVLGLNLELLQEEVAEYPQLIKYLGIAHQKNQDLQRLIRNLFEAARMEAGSISYRMT